MPNLLLGAIVAAALAVSLIVPSIAGVATWKYVLAAAGLMLFIIAGPRKFR